MFKLIFVATLFVHVNGQDNTADSTCSQQPIIQQFYSSLDFPAINLEENSRHNVAQGRPGRIGPEGPRGFKGSKVSCLTNNRRKFRICEAFQNGWQFRIFSWHFDLH